MATRDKKLELLALLEEKRRRDDVYRYKQFFLSRLCGGELVTHLIMRR